MELLILEGDGPGLVCSFATFFFLGFDKIGHLSNSESPQPWSPASQMFVRGTGNIPREELSTALGGENALLASVTSSSLSSLNITSRTTLYHTSLTNSPL